jgi:uncharacterized phage protein (TIGR01671 family)
MREIKFRAWDKRQNKMFDVSDILFSEAEVGVWLDDQNAEALPWDENLVLMQYTGLKDKNGTPIFEGDLVKRHKYWKGTHVIVSWEEKNAGFWPFCKANSYADKHYEVIGDIYSNPELLGDNSEK